MFWLKLKTKVSRSVNFTFLQTWGDPFIMGKSGCGDGSYDIPYTHCPKDWIETYSFPQGAVFGEYNRTIQPNIHMILKRTKQIIFTT